jgi:hypothetical protein
MAGINSGFPQAGAIVPPSVNSFQGNAIGGSSAYGLSVNLPAENPELIRRLSLRWMRAAGPHNEWAKIAKQCVDFLEGRQWTEEAKAAMRDMKRSALTLNMIQPLWRLVMGYQSANRQDVTYLPTSDSQSSEDVAELLSALYKAEAGRMDLKFTDSEVFADGLTGGRGWWDHRLDFEKNDFGEIKATASDPFAVYVDPDCNTYDIENSAAYIQESVWTDIDNVNSMYGPRAAEAVENLMSPAFTSSILSFLGEQDISPKRYFGQYADDKAMGNWSDVYHTDFVDRQAKRLRLLDTQYKVTTIQPCFVDLETGDKLPIPDEWLQKENQYKIQACLDHAQQLNNQLKIVNRPVKRVRWSVSCADVLLFDGWSPYETYTKVGYFPYFRRGATQGMIESLIDPQMEKNKKRSVLVDILNRSANSGWMYEDGSLDAEQEENLRKYGSAPGINVKWKSIPHAGVRQASQGPHRIEPGQYPAGLDKLEEKATDDLHEISGINKDALGQMDQVQSGRAIEAKQRQAVLAIQMYTDNFGRSKKQQGRKFLEIFQNHYTEQRIFRVDGEDSKMVTYEINKKQQTGINSITHLSDITVGEYSVEVDETPISATFKQGQFEETMMLLEKLGPMGAALLQSDPSLIIDQTSLPRKQDWIKALQQHAQQAGQPDPKIISQEKIAAAGNETKLAVAAVQGSKDASLIDPEMQRLQQFVAPPPPPPQPQAGPAQAALAAGPQAGGSPVPSGPVGGGAPVAQQPTPEGVTS